ncbi:beta-ketoacyl synthase N-terminal-like domain-containing protein [Gordonia sp. (in: high G+C Gram-positive bacteria)]|uniref:beta-ketoacyl synthase N-terminal-like domain-containing protein n=1 Tax=Gordonia sp. (in: high G+C Gram-positive bacteria) TaxID=84139 RepID=UPI00352876A5
MNDPIVIAGMAVEAPSGIESPEEFHRALAEGSDLIGPIPRDRGWPIEQLLSLGRLPGWGEVPDAGGFLTGGAQFDPQFFGLSPREAAAMDPQQRVAMRVAWRALENTGIDPSSLRDTEVGVYFGASITEYGPRAAAVNEFSGHRIAGTALGAVAGRVSHALGTIGPSMTVDSACASSINALHLAAGAVRGGECDWAIAGGVCVMGSPAAFFEFSRNNALAPDGRCHAYAASAAGTIWGEGAGAVIVERASRARELGHRVYGIVRGSRVNHNGAGGPIVVPSARAQRRLIEGTLAAAGVDPADVDYIEGHGTATLGDALELDALAQTYGAAHRGGDPALIGSVKSNAGHAQAAAGMLGLIKVLQSAGHGELPGTRFAEHPADDFDWAGSGLALAEGTREWPARDGRRFAAVSSFGVSGTNAHVVLELPEVVAEAPADRPRHRLPDGRVPVLLTGDAPELLAQSARETAEYLRAHPEAGAADVADLLLTTRRRLRHRAVVAADGREDLLEALDAVAEGVPHPAVVTGTAARRKTAYVYPGQGSQRPGMGALDYRESSAYRAAVDECHEAAMALFGASSRDYVLGDITRDDPAASDVRVVQPALFMHMIGLTAMWDAAGARPDAVIGHSQGEIAAAVRSGAMTLDEGLVIVTERARLVYELAPRGYTMAVLGVDQDECERILARNSGWAELSVVNSAHLLCISGERQMVLGIIEDLEAEGKFAREIRVEYPAHTSVVSRYQPEFLEVLARYPIGERFAPGELPCYGATLGEPIDASMSLGDYWFWNLRNRVRFDAAIARAAADGVEVFIEMAENPTLALAMAETLSGVERPTTVLATRRRDCEDLALFTRNVAALAVADRDFDWSALAADPAPSGSMLDDFPNTPMRRTHLWADRDAGLFDAVNRPGAPAPGRDARVLLRRWERLTQRTLLPPRRMAVLDPTGRCASWAEALCASAGEQGARAEPVVPGEPLRGGTDTLVLLVPGQDSGPAAESIADVLADAAWHGAGELPREFVCVTVRAVAVTDDEDPDPVGAAVAAALRCGAAEFTGTRFRQVDVADPLDGRALVSALHVDAPELAVRDGGLFAKVLEEIADDAPDWTPEDLAHVLITGGTGRLGVEFCEHLAARGSGRITLISRSGGDDGTRARIAGITRRHRVPVDVIRMDLTEPFDSAQEPPGEIAAHLDALDVPVTLVVHAALDYVSADLAAVGREDVRRALDAKAAGLRRVLGAVGDGLRGVLMCSSLAATLGGRGQALYAAGNALLEAEAAALRRRGVPATAVAWGLWRTVGPLDDDAVARVTATGVIPMAPDVALAAGARVRGADPIVMSADWPALRELLALSGQDGLLGEVGAAAPAPEVTAVVEAEPETPEEPPIAEPVAVPDTAVPRDLAGALCAELAAAMGMAASDLDPQLPLVALGLDSLQALDFRKRVKGTLGHDLPVEAILGGATLDEVVELMTAA